MALCHVLALTVAEALADRPEKLCRLCTQLRAAEQEVQDPPSGDRNLAHNTAGVREASQDLRHGLGEERRRGTEYGWFSSLRRDNQPETS